MSKTVPYDGKRWAGSVTFRDPLYLPDVLAIEEAQEAVAEIRAAANGNLGMKAVSQVHTAWLVPICDVVEKWELQDFPDEPTPASFPATPRLEAAKLMSFLIGEMMKIYQGDAELVSPNG